MAFQTQYEWLVGVVREEFKEGIKPVINDVGEVKDGVTAVSASLETFKQEVRGNLERLDSEFDTRTYRRDLMDQMLMARDAVNKQEHDDLRAMIRRSNKHNKRLRKELVALRKAQATAWERTVAKFSAPAVLVLALLQIIFYYHVLK